MHRRAAKRTPKARRKGWGRYDRRPMTFRETRTGRPGRHPLEPPDDVVDRVRHLGRSIGVDPLPLLAERADEVGWSPPRTMSAGGQARLMPTVDGWLALNLARPDDVASLPAWLECDPIAEPDPWSTVGAMVAERRGADLAERAELLGLAVGVVGEVGPPDSNLSVADLPVGHTTWTGSEPLKRPPRVLDLSSLWAGPLCSRLLAERGADVVEIESISRPDGARLGPPDFYRRLHVGKRSVVVDLRTSRGVAHLVSMLEEADVVIEASRPRALAQLGIDPARLLAGPTGPKVWVSITGHGRASARVAFGDDAAAAGGLVARDDDGPCFAFDAVADPLSGVTAAAAAAAALTEPGRWLIDVAMAGVAAFVAGNHGDRCWVAHP
jgi:hypothetical protein